MLHKLIGRRCNRFNTNLAVGGPRVRIGVSLATQSDITRCRNSDKEVVIDG